MARRKRKQDKNSGLAETVGGLALGLAVMLGAANGFRGIIDALLWLVLGFAGIALVVFLLRRSSAGQETDAAASPTGKAADWRRRTEKNHPDVRDNSVHATRSARTAYQAEKPTASVAAVEPASKPTVWSLELIRSLDWKRFEELVAAYWRACDYRAETTGRGADGGVDVLLYKPSNPEQVLGVIQCKSRADQDIGVSIVRELFGVMHHTKASLGVLATTSGFTVDARAFANGKHLKLLDGPALLQLISQLSQQKQQSLLDLATAGDYTTPSCPTCDVKLVKRTRRSDGQHFYGCPNYPRCHYKMNNKALGRAST
ncbi:restriction endonuclease [Nevskia sp.]|uniref:restriction endonuclease n=1 Tax=Nevskia sp. TaxID=1929292 RepID=UPI0025E3DBE1|nr:restriction endonuclease [Nevskia sp.]